MAKYKVIGAEIHKGDGTSYGHGATVDLSDADAAVCLKAGTVVLLDGPRSDVDRFPQRLDGTPLSLGEFAEMYRKDCESRLYREYDSYVAAHKSRRADAPTKPSIPQKPSIPARAEETKAEETKVDSPPQKPVQGGGRKVEPNIL